MTERWHEMGAASAYVAGDLAPELVDEFEQHILSCADCRAQIVAGGAATAELRVAPVRVRRRRTATGIALAALAATLLIAFVWREGDRTRLGRVSAPEFMGAAARSSPDSATARIDRAMQAYAQRDFGTAGRLLTEAVRTDSSPAVSFYLGVSLLQTERPEPALTALLRARAPASNPYADDATLFAAKALVQLHRPDSAAALLRRAIDAGQASGALRAFADSLTRR